MILYEDILAVLDEVDQLVKSSRVTGCQHAENLCEYRKELAKTMLRLKASGMAVSIAKDVARGEPRIAEMKRAELASEALHRADLEAIQAKKLRVRIMQAELDKEWGNPRVGEGQ